MEDMFKCHSKKSTDDKKTGAIVYVIIDTYAFPTTTSQNFCCKKGLWMK